MNSAVYCLGQDGGPATSRCPLPDRYLRLSVHVSPQRHRSSHWLFTAACAAALADASLVFGCNHVDASQSHSQQRHSCERTRPRVAESAEPLMGHSWNSYNRILPSCQIPSCKYRRPGRFVTDSSLTVRRLASFSLLCWPLHGRLLA